MPPVAKCDPNTCPMSREIGEIHAKLDTLVKQGESLQDAINGNGNPGIKTRIASLWLYIKFLLWGVGLMALGTFFLILMHGAEFLKFYK